MPQGRRASGGVIHHRALNDLPGGAIEITPEQARRAALALACAAVGVGASRDELADALGALGLGEAHARAALGDWTEI